MAWPLSPLNPTVPIRLDIETVLLTIENENELQQTHINNAFASSAQCHETLHIQEVKTLQDATRISVL